MAVMAREVWTDERLDDLNKRVDEGFKETREEFRAVRSELGGQIAALHRMTFQLFVGMMVTMALGFGGLIVTLIVQN
ncbi:MAG TPA: hypothetical protein VFZ19_04420 [Solirubrobacterales bacterium]